MIDPSEIAAARQALGRLLAKYRKAAGLNQHQLAPHTHYGRTAPRGVPSYPWFSREELEGRFLGLMPNLVPKGSGGQ